MLVEYALVSRHLGPMVSTRVSCMFAFCSLMIFIMPEEKERGALLVAACIIAAIRLRGEEVRPSPKLRATIYDSVQLAVMVLREVKGQTNVAQ